MADNPTWGIVATIKASGPDCLAFAAHHIALGAHRLYLYLDAPDGDLPDPDTQQRLKSHPKIRLVRCDERYWRQRNGKAPVKHQVRQTQNATHAYARKPEVDWLIHMDVDEFLWPENTVAAHLSALPASVFCARIRPDEQLSGDGTAFKRFIPKGPERAVITKALYPTYGQYLKGGFLSHVAGKLFVRTGSPDIAFRIHNVFQGDLMNPGETDLSDIALLHCHAKTWDDWLARFQYRLDKGAYRSDLAPAEKGGDTLHQLLTSVSETEGETGLRQFFEEVAADTPTLRDRLSKHGMLRLCDLDLTAKVQKHFG